MVSLLLAMMLVLIPPATSADPAERGVWPLFPEPRVLRPFAPPVQRWESGHRGVDLSGDVGQEVYSALPGRVSFAGRIGGKPVVVVNHGTTRTTYEPVAAFVRPGDQVEAGQRLGVLSLAFSHCYPAACLHWGLRRDKEYLDPLALLGERPQIRLLPLWS